MFPGCNLLDFTDPLTTSDVTGRLVAQLAYRVDVLSEGGAQVQSAPGLAMQAQGLDNPAFDTLVTSDDNGPREDAFSPRLIAFVQEAAAHSWRMTSVRSGTFVLAAAGLLDGRRVTTHQRMAALLQRHYPCVQVQSDHIFTHDGPV